MHARLEPKFTMAVSVTCSSRAFVDHPAQLGSQECRNHGGAGSQPCKHTPDAEHSAIARGT
jgi:hypothetical protein